MTDTLQTNEFDDVTPEATMSETTNGSSPVADYNTTQSDVTSTADVFEPAVDYSASEPTSAQESWKAIQNQATALFANLPDYVTNFFRNNKRLLITLGWILLAFLGIRLLFATLDTIDDIPLISPTLELIGLIYTSWFVYRYLIRESDRQQLSQTIKRFKSEVFGQTS